MSFGGIVWLIIPTLALVAPSLRNRYFVKTLLALAGVLGVVVVQSLVSETVMNVSAVILIIAVATLCIWATLHDRKTDPHADRVKLAKKQRDERRARGIKWP